MTTSLTLPSSGSTTYNSVQSALNAVDQTVVADETHDYSVNSTTPATDTNYGNKGATGSNSLAAGVNASAAGDNATAVGSGATATGNGSIAMGFNASSAATNDVAIGTGAAASGAAGGAAVSIGAGNTASGAGAVAIGDPSVATGTGAVAIGANDTAVGAGSVALGNTSTAGGAGGVALGNGAVASNAGDVALGSGSVTEAAVGTSGATINGQDYAFAGTTPASTVSVGAPGAERTITNLAAGQISATSTDAINGSELYAADQAIDALGTEVNNLGKGGSFVSNNSNNAPAPTATGSNASAGGYGASASGANSTVVGNNSTDNGAGNSTVVGQGASVAAGAAGSNVALGQGSVASTGAQTNYTAPYLSTPQSSVGEVSVGSASGQRQITNVAAGSAPTDAVNVAQLEGALSGTVQYDNPGHTSVTLGGVGATTPVAVNNVAAGAVTSTSTQAVNGSQLYAVTNGAAGPFQVYQSGSVAAPTASAVGATAGGDGAVASGQDSTAIGYHASATGANSVALGANSSDGGRANTVSVGSPTNLRTISNVAAGTQLTDAVNLGQLLSSQSYLLNNFNAGIALSLSASGLAYDPRPGTTSLAGGASYYNGHEGFAFGLGHTSDDGNWRYHVGVSFVSPEDHADVGVVAGFTYTFSH